MIAEQDDRALVAYLSHLRYLGTGRANEEDHGNCQAG